MSAVDLTIKNATHTATWVFNADDNSLAKDLLKLLCVRLGLPEPGNPGRIGQLFDVPAGQAFLYDPCRGVFDPEQTLAQNGIKTGTVIHFFYQLPFVGNLAAIKLQAGQLLSAVGRYMVVEWRGRPYPIILPALVTPQGHIEGSLLNIIVFNQIVEISGQSLENEWLKEWRYYHTRLQNWLNPYDAANLLGDLLKHGDLLKLQAPDDILKLDLDSLDLGNDIKIVSDEEQDILNQITITRQD